MDNGYGAEEEVSVGREGELNWGGRGVSGDGGKLDLGGGVSGEERKLDWGGGGVSGEEGKLGWGGGGVNGEEGGNWIGDGRLDWGWGGVSLRVMAPTGEISGAYFIGFENGISSEFRDTLT